MAVLEIAMSLGWDTLDLQLSWHQEWLLEMAGRRVVGMSSHLLCLGTKIEWGKEAWGIDGYVDVFYALKSSIGRR